MTEKIRPQDKWDQKAGVKTFSYKLHITTGEAFKAACKERGVSQSKALETFMQSFIDGTATIGGDHDGINRFD